MELKEEGYEKKRGGRGEGEGRNEGETGEQACRGGY